ncbi:MAG: hypothetical protein ACXVFQ_18380 [Solirubrobacteraceae bacterium]
MGQLNFRLSDDDENLMRELAADRGVGLTELVRGLVAQARTEHGLTRAAERQFIAGLTEKYGPRELEVQVQPIPVKKAVGVGAAIVSTPGKRTWLRPDEITVTTTADDETGRLHIYVGAPESDARFLLADVDPRHAVAVRVPLADLHPDSARVIRRKRSKTTETR